MTRMLKLILSISIINFLKAIFYRKYIFTSRNVKIRGIKNIILEDNAKLLIGFDNPGFIHSSEFTFLNIRGGLIISGKVKISTGNRIDVSRGGSLRLTNCILNGPSKYIIANKSEIGNNTIISWDCQIIDSDFHKVNNEISSKPIIIGENVWIGSRVNILKGVEIANDCIVASSSNVTKTLNKTNCLFAGNPAKIIKEGVAWS